MQSNFWAGSKSFGTCKRTRPECTTHANIVEILRILAQKTASLMVLPVQGGRSVMLVFGACFHAPKSSIIDRSIFCKYCVSNLFEPKSYRSKISGLTNPIRL